MVCCTSVHCVSMRVSFCSASALEEAASNSSVATVASDERSMVDERVDMVLICRSMSSATIASALFPLPGGVVWPAEELVDRASDFI